MLVLTRKTGESLVLAIGGTITVTVVACRSGRVRLGIVAPEHVRVTRATARSRVSGPGLPKKG